VNNRIVAYMLAIDRVAYTTKQRGFTPSHRQSGDGRSLPSPVEGGFVRCRYPAFMLLLWCRMLVSTRFFLGPDQRFVAPTMNLV